MFVDKVSVLVRAGKGGNGHVSFRKEKFIDKGGPDGGDGGNGGDIVLVGSNRENTLAAFRYQKEIVAKDGSPGAKRKKHGKSAPHALIPVPIGTVLYNEHDELIADITEDGQKVVVARGGKGGFGNAHFTSSVRQVPRVAEKGEPGEEYTATMELKMIAEVGLVGLPNAGKSTLLARISNAKPEIANYPFTTLKPNLGVADIGDNRSLLVADIPGLIEGASEGKGLGDEFLRHVERTRVLIHLIDAYSADIAADYRVIIKELAAYKADLSKRPQIVAINKTEGLDQEIIDDHIKTLSKVADKGTEIIAISAASGTNVTQLLSKAAAYADRAQQVIDEQAEDTLPVIRLKDDNLAWHVRNHEGVFTVTGRKIERFAVRTDFDNPDGIRRLRDIMRKMGIMHELERQKINPGDTIQIGYDGRYGTFTY